MTTPASPFSASITNADGSITNLSGSVVMTVTPPPVVVPPPPKHPVIPGGAQTVDMLPLTSWAMNHDAGTPGAATGTSKYPATAFDGSPNCREFDFILTAGGGEIYHLTPIPNASTLRNLCIDMVLSSPNWGNIACLESDLNWVDAKGNVTIIGQQLDKHSGTAEITGVTSGKAHWIKTSVKADPTQFAPGAQHSIQWFASHDGNGNVTYQGVSIDGVYFPIGVTVASLDPLNWGKNILNFQLQFDGLDTSSKAIASTVYAHKLMVHGW